MTVFGLTSTGYVAKTVDDILTELAEAQRAAPSLGPDIRTDAESLLGQMNGIMATQLRGLWELGEAVYLARTSRGASCAALDELAKLTGRYRLPATQGTVTLSVTLNAGVTLPAGNVVHVDGDPTNRWVTLAPAPNPGGVPAAILVAARAETAGRYVANAGTLTVIATPYSGWTGATNTLDAVPGRALESDPALRQRRDRVIRAGGSSPVDAIREALLRVTDVLQVSVFENDTDDTVGTLPPHSVEAVVTGGTTQAVAEALFAAKGGGIYTQGELSALVVDASGTYHVVRFSRPAEVLVYVAITVERDASRYAGDTAVKAAVVAAVEALLAGDNVRLSALSRSTLAVAGVADVTVLRVGRAVDGTVAANLLIGPREIAVLDASRVAVTTADVTP